MAKKRLAARKSKKSATIRRRPSTARRAARTAAARRPARAKASTPPTPALASEPPLAPLVKLARAQRETTKRAESFSAARKRLRARKSDPPLVAVLARDQVRRVGKRKKVTARAGDRVALTDRRKVFIFRHTRPSKKYPSGRLVPYYDRKEKKQLKKIGLFTGGKKAVAPRSKRADSIDPGVFKSKAVKKFYYARATPLSRLRATVQRKKRQRAPLDFMDQVVPKVADKLKAAADEFADRRHFRMDCAAVVRLPDGSARTIRFDADFKQADVQQFMELGFYIPWIEKKLYAEFAEQLKGFGLVTTGSAQFIQALSINQGRDRKDWRDSKGMLWKHGQGWNLAEVELIRFDATPQLVSLQ